ncbi:glycosyltransferase [Enterovibrio norvegicus FF-162]|uniref:MJ1255/VC2487 family glycosyltransferase n=1 Tax=Enterovibrio norvegicus TaxID=188144 RepID=UPI0002E1A313|nr:MJ1255/VC2487 family glycosyltransferase [Enterovibrio norvegicus]OEE74408.1 glycosyltransferase [Enterovibrio norvegicus FF-162]
MKILYGVQGTGNGHISRARAMAQALAETPSIEVQFLFSGRAESAYFDMAVFGDYMVRRGFTFFSHAGKIDHVKTALNNNLWQFMQEVRSLDVTQYDLVISDFEPVTAHAAKHRGVPSLSISHQSAFLYDVPKQGQTLIDKAIMRFFAPTELNIGLHWYHFNQPVLPPIIDLKPNDSHPKSGAVLVYLPFERLDSVLTTLRHFSSSFICFHPDCQNAAQDGNVDLRPLSKAEFQQALFACDGVIANGGFELPSEALSLGKKLLLKPLSGQFEQQSNVTTLDILGLASTMESLDINAIRQWLAHSESQRVKYPEVAEAIAQWLAVGDTSTLPELHEQLWSQVEFPEHVNDLLSDFWPSQRRKQAMFNMKLPVGSNKKAKQY